MQFNGIRDINRMKHQPIASELVNSYCLNQPPARSSEFGKFLVTCMIFFGPEFQANAFSKPVSHAALVVSGEYLKQLDVFTNQLNWKNINTAIKKITDEISRSLDLSWYGGFVNSLITFRMHAN